MIAVSMVYTGCLLTTLLLMQALGSRNSHQEILDMFAKLSDVDPYRHGYYQDMRKFVDFAVLHHYDVIILRESLYSGVLTSSCISRWPLSLLTEIPHPIRPGQTQRCSLLYWMYHLLPPRASPGSTTLNTWPTFTYWTCLVISSLLCMTWRILSLWTRSLLMTIS